MIQRLKSMALCLNIGSSSFFLLIWEGARCILGVIRPHPPSMSRPRPTLPLSSSPHGHMDSTLSLLLCTVTWTLLSLSLLLCTVTWALWHCLRVIKWLLSFLKVLMMN